MEGGARRVVDIVLGGFGGIGDVVASASAGPWLPIAAIAAGIVIPWIYMLIRPPPPKICGTRNGPLITAPRIRLRDGRYMAYKEAGVPKDKAKYKIISVHPFGGSRHSLFPVSQELMEKLGVYIVAFDRPGYGQSDPFPQRSIKTQAEDIQELADQLQLGDKFYIVAISIGGFSAWGCLKHIPHRLAGVALMAPVVNYWWPGANKEIAREAFYTQCLGDRLSLRIAHHAPWLLHFWLTQTLLPTSTTVRGIEKYMNKMDLEISAARMRAGIPEHQQEAVQQGISESLHRDMAIQFGKWDFFPGDLPNKGIPVQIWQGNEDYLVPVGLQRHVRECLPWVEYRELPGVGHLIDLVPGLNDQVLTTLLTAGASSR